MRDPIVEIIPERWASQGEAEAVVRGRPVRIWAGIPDEPGLVRLVHRGQHVDIAAWVGSDHPHPRRVKPRCERFNLCGGCPLMHLDEEGQLLAKRQIVRDALEAEGLGDLSVGRVLPSPTGFDDFRHIIKLGVGLSDRKALRVGAWGRSTKSIVPIPKCHVATPTLRTVMETVARAVRKHELMPWDAATGRGVLRAFVLRQSSKTGEVLVTVVAGRRDRALEAMTDQILTEAREVVGVALHLNEEPGNALFVRDEDGRVPFKPLGGRMVIEEQVDDFVIPLGPGDFFQTHPAMAAALFRDVLDRLELEAGEPVVDLYCGAGGLTLMAAKRTGWALGVEEVDTAVQAARQAAAGHGLQVEFQAGKVLELLPTLAARLADARPVVIVDPARRGLEPGVIDAILALKPRRMAYISCNPKALARDLAALKAGGMEPDAVSLYDMFPNTAHTESVVVLRAPDAAGLVRRAPQRRRAGSAR